MDDNRKNSDRYITGLETVPTSGDYADSNTNLRSDLSQETNTRTIEDGKLKDADTAINKASFGNDSTPTGIDDDDLASPHSLQKQISDEVSTRTSMDKYITGLDNIPIEGSYKHSNEKLYTALIDEIAERERVDKQLYGADDIGDLTLTTIDIDLTEEINDRLANDEAINKAAFGTETTPTSGDSLQTQISANKKRLDELDNTYATDKQLTDAVETEAKARIEADSNNLIEAKGYVDKQDIFETDILTLEKVGGIDAGTDLDGMTTHEILRTLLYPYIAFVIKSSSRNAAADTLENGVTQTLSSATISITKKSKPITSVKLMNGSTVLEEKTGVEVENGGTITFNSFDAITVTKTNNPNLKFIVTDGTTSTEENVGASIFVYPYYMGECVANATIDETLIKGLTKKVESKGKKTVTHSCENGRMIIAYPKAHGVLKSILDPNNFETIGDYTRSEVSITGLDGTAQTYYVYASGAATVSGFKVQYKY